MVPIDKLPVEILVWIFRELRDMHVDSGSHGGTLVTHVCRTWRLDALNTAELWTEICSLDPDCVQAFLTRSTRMPLDICYPQAKHRDSRLGAVLPMIHPESSRFRRVESPHPSMAHMFLVHPFPGGAPLLTHLNLDYRYISETWTLNAGAVLADVIPKICDHGLPALRQLRLECWPLALLSSLRSLFTPSLRLLAMTMPRTRHSASTWADILTGLPLLEELVLASAFPHPGPGDGLASRQEQLPLIQLPHLSRLEVTDYNPADQLSLLRRITPSNDLHIEYGTYAHPHNLHCPKISLEQYMDILHAVSQKFAQEQHKTPIYLTSLDLRFVTHSIYAYPGLRATLSTVAEDASNPYCLRPSSSSDVPPILILTCLPLEIIRHDFYTPLSDMLRTTFTWSKLRKLCLAGVHTSTPVQDALAFKSLFAQMTNLHFLSIPSSYINDCLFTLLGAFDTPVGPDAEEGASTATRVLFPALEVLTVHGRPDGENGEYESLRRTLLCRTEAGFPTPRVHICLDGWAITGRIDVVEVAPLTSTGCSVDVCVKQGDGWCIEKFVSTC